MHLENRLWAIEVAMQLPSARIAAYDISDGHFPLPEYRPSNVTFDSLDFLGEIPSSMVGQFDVVHLRTWAFIIRDNDPSCLIQNASKLLSGFFFLRVWWRLYPTSEADCIRTLQSRMDIFNGRTLDSTVLLSKVVLRPNFER